MLACGRSRFQTTAVQQFALFDSEFTTTSNLTGVDPPPSTGDSTPNLTTNPDSGPITVTTSDGSVITIPPADPSATTSSGAEPIPQEGISSDSNSTNAGAIAGGVVGGVGGIALIAALVWFFLRRRRKENSADGTASDFDQGPAASATYQPGPQDPPLHPAQYGTLSNRMSQATLYNGENSNRGLGNFAQGLGAGAGAGAAGAFGADSRASRASRGASSYLAVSHRTNHGNDDEARPVSPISSANVTVCSPTTASAGHMAAAGPVSPESTMAMPYMPYDRSYPPPPHNFQAYRPYGRT